MNKLYISKRTGEEARLIETNANTVVIQLVATDETKEIALSTFKRWWGPAPEAQNTPEQPKSAAEQPEETTEATRPSEAEKAAMEPMRLSEIVGKLEALFDLLNGIYFEGKLIRPVITVQSTPKFYGHCTTKQIWKSDTEALYEINIGAEHINRPKENIAATMCHEMVHLYCLANDIRDTCQNGRYHNKTFKKEAEARDLHIEYDRANGYTHTTPTEVFAQKLTDNGFDLSVPFARHSLTKQKSSGDREKPHKYVCPECGQTVRSTQELHISCSLCEVNMEREG